MGFVGSVETGRVVAREAVEKFKGATPELGDENPIIVIPDANAKMAAAALGPVGEGPYRECINVPFAEECGSGCLLSRDPDAAVSLAATHGQGPERPLSCDLLLLIADEPTTALDATTEAQIVDLVMRLRRELGMAVIWITHDLSVAAGCVDKVIVMYAGQNVESAPIREFYANPRHPYSIGLLRSFPKLDSASLEKLTSIQGLPSNLIDMPDRCLFLGRPKRGNPYRPVVQPQGKPESGPIGLFLFPGCCLITTEKPDGA